MLDKLQPWIFFPIVLMERHYYTLTSTYLTPFSSVFNVDFEQWFLFSREGFQPQTQFKVKIETVEKGVKYVVS